MTREPVDLAIKRAPRQKRAVETYERILDVAARLLAGIGIERISTNLIAAEAGIKIPTLYRYFPNKYAVLMALGTRLMERQNAIIEEWLARSAASPEPDALIEDIAFLLDRTIDVTMAEPGALATTLALRAVPRLQDLRLSSHRLVSDLIADHVAARLPGTPREEIWPRVRLSVELSYAAVEMALEEPRIDVETVKREAAAHVRAYWRDWLAGAAQER
jgi:AcrR family transcriptional regulator